MNATIESSQMMYCRGCGKQLHISAIACPACGATQPGSNAGGSSKRLLPAFLLCFLFGIFGVHRFYVGKIGTGIVQLLTFGGLGIWALVDLILILCSAFTDAEGHKITQWT
jgi:hypothetical protein